MDIWVPSPAHSLVQLALSQFGIHGLGWCVNYGIFAGAGPIAIQ